MACNFSQLKRRQSSNSLLGKQKSVTEEDLKDQFYRQRVRSRSRSIGKFEGRERIQKLKQIRQNTETNYQTIHAGIEPRKPLKVAFSPLEKAESVGSGTGLPPIQGEITEEEEDQEKEDEVFDDEGKGLTKESTYPDEEGQGETWDSKLTFILATIGYAVGLGNIWRFPYLAQKNGGGAFLIPYCIALFFLGLPLFILELAIGQRLRKGSIGVWKQISPYLGGIGLASGAVAFNVALYYNTIIAWCLKYLVQSFFVPLPWSACPVENETSVENYRECQLAGPTAYFWYRETLDISTDVESPEKINWVIGICLVSSWLLVYLAMVKGITESPKVVYITAIFPYVVLVIFFFRAVTLKGMGDGVIHLFTPKFSLLLDPMTWLEAGTQIFFSLGLSFGSLIAYSSYNPVTNNCLRDAFIVAFTNCCTSVFAAIIIFGIMGFKAHKIFDACLDSNMQLMNQSSAMGEGWVMVDGDNRTLPVCDLQEQLEKSASGTGLAFILFTDAVNQFPLSNIWSLLFFCMLFTLGLDSQFGTLQGVIQAATDLNLFPENMRKEVQTGLICGTCCILSLVFANGAGNYIFTIFDNFSANIPLLVIALFECVGVAYFYGLQRFCEDIELMTGSRPGLYLCICWKFISPAIMTAILVAFLLKMFFGEVDYEAWDAATGSAVIKTWPWWTYIMIVMLISMSVMWIPFIAILELCGLRLLKQEKPGWFPTEELREDNSVQPHKITEIERKWLGWREDGQEGVCWQTQMYQDRQKEEEVLV